MQRLNPKSVWLFFISNLASVLPLVLVLIIIFFQFIFQSSVDFALNKNNIHFPWGSVIFVIIAYAIFCYIWAKLTYHFWYYELSEDALKIEKGIIWKKYISIPYERIQNIDVYRGVWARILGLGDLQVQTAGYSGGYGRNGMGSTEGKLPGLDMRKAEQLRDELIKKVKGTKQGL